VFFRSALGDSIVAYPPRQGLWKKTAASSAFCNRNCASTFYPFTHIQRKIRKKLLILYPELPAIQEVRMKAVEIHPSLKIGIASLP
jgi:hypothetical protein